MKRYRLSELDGGDLFKVSMNELAKASGLYEEILEEGRVEGRAAARVEGRLGAQRAAIFDVLQLRFGVEAASEFEEGLRAILDTEKLAELHRLAVRCRTLTQFRRRLQSD